LEPPEKKHIIAEYTREAEAKKPVGKDALVQPTIDRYVDKVRTTKSRPPMQSAKKQRYKGKHAQPTSGLK